jgi:hypothetical protein
MDQTFHGDPTPMESGGGDIQCEIMTIMHVIMVMLLCQAAMGRVPVLQCLLPGARGRLRLCAVMPVI